MKVGENFPLKALLRCSFLLFLDEQVLKIRFSTEVSMWPMVFKIPRLTSFGHFLSVSLPCSLQPVVPLLHTAVYYFDPRRTFRSSSFYLSLPRSLSLFSPHLSLKLTLWVPHTHTATSWGLHREFWGKKVGFMRGFVLRKRFQSQEKWEMEAIRGRMKEFSMVYRGSWMKSFEVQGHTNPF